MRHLPKFTAAIMLMALPALATPRANPRAASGAARGALAPELRDALYCAAALALASDEQRAGTPAALALPPLEDRGKRYFAQIGARAIDEAGLTREAVRDLLIADVAEVRRRAAVDSDQQSAAQAKQCLARLDAAVPPAP